MVDAQSEQAGVISTPGVCSGVQNMQEASVNNVLSRENLDTVISELKECLPFPWIAVSGENGIYVLLLSRDHEKSVQRRVFFSFSGVEEVSMHRKSLSGTLLQEILKAGVVSGTSSGLLESSPYVERVMTVVQRLKSFEVCVGVNKVEFMPLWGIDKRGVVDNNPFGELRYTSTFRPSKCDLLVSTDKYLRQRCSVCMKTTRMFRLKIQRHRSDAASPNAPNIYLDRPQLLNKVSLQQKKLKCSHAKLSRLRQELQQALSCKSLSITERLSEEILKICLAYTEEE